MERDALDGGGVSDIEWMSTADRSPEPLPSPLVELPVTLLPGLLDVPTGSDGAIAVRCPVTPVVRRPGSLSPVVVAAVLRSDDRLVGSDRGLPTASAEVASQIASVSATACAVCCLASGCFSIIRK